MQVGDEVFLCHREVISTRCDYFAAMLRHDWAETTLKEVILGSIMICIFLYLFMLRNTMLKGPLTNEMSYTVQWTRLGQIKVMP